MKATNIPYIIIILLLVVIFLLRECGPGSKPVPPKVDTVYIDSIVLVPVFHHYSIPKPYAVIDTFIIPAFVDTALILADWFLKRDYELPIIDDSTGKLTLTTSVSKNQLGAYQVQGTLKQLWRTQTITKTITLQERNKLLAGFILGYNGKDIGIAPTLYYLSKKHHLYSVSYDPFNKVGYAGMGWVIKLKGE